MTQPSKLAITWAELLLVLVLVLAGLGAWRLAVFGAAAFGAAREPAERVFHERYGVAGHEAEREMAERILESLRAKQLEQRLESARHRAVLEAIEAIHPTIREEGDAAELVSTRDAYRTGELTASATERFLAMLADDIAAQESALAAHDSTLRAARRDAQRAFEKAQASHASFERRLAAGGGALLLGLLFTTSHLMLPVAQRQLLLPVRRSAVIGLAGVALMLLLTHAVAGVTGALLAGFVTVVIAAVVSWRSEQSP